MTFRHVMCNLYITLHSATLNVAYITYVGTL